MKVSEMKKSLHSEMKRHMGALRNAPKTMRAAMPYAVSLAKKLARMKLEPNVFAGASGKVYVSLSYKVSTFKDPKLVEILELGLAVLGEAGIGSTDYADIGLREYKFDNSLCRFEVNARLEGEGSALCRRVEIGEEVQVVKKYAFKCD